MTTLVKTKSRDPGLSQIVARGPEEQIPAASGETAVAGSPRPAFGFGHPVVAAVADSGVEHYRGSFHNPGMYLPLAVGSVGLAAS